MRFAFSYLNANYARRISQEKMDAGLFLERQGGGEVN